jgi:hypothetical protein
LAGIEATQAATDMAANPKNRVFDGFITIAPDCCTKECANTAICLAPYAKWRSNSGACKKNSITKRVDVYDKCHHFRRAQRPIAAAHQCCAPPKACAPQRLRLLRYGSQARAAAAVMVAEFAQRFRKSGGITRRYGNPTARRSYEAAHFAVHGADPSHGPSHLEHPEEFALYNQALESLTERDDLDIGHAQGFLDSQAAPKCPVLRVLQGPKDGAAGTDARTGAGADPIWISLLTYSGAPGRLALGQKPGLLAVKLRRA